MHAAHKALGRLRADVVEYAHRMKKERPDINTGVLQCLAREAFAIEPLAIGELVTITVETWRRDYRNEYDCWMSGYLHEGKITYAGAPLFWRLQLVTPMRFSLRGQIGTNSVRLRSFIDGEDYWGFKEGVEKELAYAREMLMTVENGMCHFADQAREIVEEALQVTAS